PGPRPGARSTNRFRRRLAQRQPRILRKRKGPRLMSEPLPISLDEDVQRIVLAWMVAKLPDDVDAFLFVPAAEEALRERGTMLPGDSSLIVQVSDRLAFRIDLPALSGMN